MAHIEDITTSYRTKHRLSTVAFCLACIAINFLGMRIASATGLPLYLDCTGILLASIVGGFLPGVIVGYATNLINTLIEPTSFYYAVISMLIAATATLLERRGWFRSIPKTVLAIAIFAFFGGGVASVLTWNLFGFSSGNGISSTIVEALHDNTDLTPFLSQLSGDYLIDLLDKTIVVVMALVIRHFLPKKLLERLDFSFWQQRPLSDEDKSTLRHSQPRRMSVGKKIGIGITVIMVSASIVTTSISYYMFNDSMVGEQAKKAQGITSLAKHAIDPDRVDDFLENGRQAQGYAETEKALADIRDNFEGVQYIYVYRILKDGCHVVLDPDTASEKGSEPGDVVEFDQAFMPYLDDLLAGERIDPIISDESYGWLLTVYEPIYSTNGKCVCYVAADINMGHIIGESEQFITRIIALFSAFFILIFVLVLWLAEYSLVLPLNSIAHATSGFAFDSAADRKGTLEMVNALDIRTGDEVENLYHAVVKTAEDTVNYIVESQEQAATIARMQDNLIMVMADLVESRDQFTGDHVRKTAAYALIIMEQMRAEGIYANRLTHDFVSDVYHSAPLHDIGKIAVSDTILNKPGRLTPEEFEIMKSHTTAGRQIIERAVGALSEETYLDEAKNLAEFHHEKWDGTGYPTGRAGENIPLSARIMAVADVFDALVSKRSYKDGFPLEKAYAIIEEGIGTHFDPKIARAFLNAREEIEIVVRRYGDGQTDKEQS